MSNHSRGSVGGSGRASRAAICKTRQRLVAVALFQIAVERQRALSYRIKRITNGLTNLFGIAKHHAGRWLMLAKQRL